MRLSDKLPKALVRRRANAVDAAISYEQPLVGRAAKRVLDLAVAMLGLAVLWPTFLLVSAVIKIGSHGPVFRCQPMHGYNNEIIPVLKFRTPPVSQMERDPPFATRFGAVLRETGLDGLPQLINVLRGEMSMVGPSPHFAPPSGTLVERNRNLLKPGITGWAQVNGCCGESILVTRRRMEYDRYYIEEWSFLLDIKIIMMTLFSVQ
jgi:lipopolysaccharide/colanic/teichoic acid biosynthesis glycosyltransferase